MIGKDRSLRDLRERREMILIELGQFKPHGRSSEPTSCPFEVCFSCRASRDRVCSRCFSCKTSRQMRERSSETLVVLEIIVFPAPIAASSSRVRAYLRGLLTVSFVIAFTKGNLPA